MKRLGVVLVLLVPMAWLLGSEALHRAEGTEAAATSPVAQVAAAREPAALPQPAFSYTLRQGRDLFLHYCATCHGEEGRGDGFNAYNLDPKPRDLTEAALQEQRSDEELAEVIRSGGGAIGLSTGMPPWGETLNDRQVDQLVAYLRHLPRLAEMDEDGE